MPDESTPNTALHTPPPCAGASDCSGAAQNLQRCMNCRREVEASLSRIAGRRLRKLRHLEECAPERCAEFLKGITDESMRLHLASMAWWRFSADSGSKAEPVFRIMTTCKAVLPDSGADYMHRALQALSPLSQAQLSTWFGCENLYQIAALFFFEGERLPDVGRHCSKCRLYQQGCTAYDKRAADTCPFWDDPFLQDVAKELRRTGEWRDPCRTKASKEVPA